MDDQTKFYGEVRILPKVSHGIERERGHQRLNPDRLTGRLAFDVAAWQRLHIGSGELLPPDQVGLAADAPLLKAFFRAGESLTLPGSSLKGALRSLVELFTRACVNKTTVRWHGSEREIYGECRYNARRRQGDLCLACKLFGAMGYQGQVRFDDAPQVKGGHEIHSIPPQYRPVPDREQRRYYPYGLSDTRERTWPLEVATVGSRFAAQGQFTNLGQDELGVLLIALGAGNWGLCPRIGAAKSSGLGGVRIENLVVEKWQVQQAYRTFDGEVWKAVNLQACIEAARPLLRSEVLDKLAGDLGDASARGA